MVHRSNSSQYLDNSPEETTSKFPADEALITKKNIKLTSPSLTLPLLIKNQELKLTEQNNEAEEKIIKNEKLRLRKGSLNRGRNLVPSIENMVNKTPSEGDLSYITTDQINNGNDDEEEETKLEDKSLITFKHPIQSIHCSLPLEKVTDILDKLNIRHRSVVSSGASSDSVSSVSFSKSMCLYCDRSFTSHNLREKHSERVHQANKGRRLSSRISIQPTTAAYPGCTFCNTGKISLLQSDDLNGLFIHLLHKHSDKYFACKKCMLRFPNEDSLLEHNHEIHHHTKLHNHNSSTSSRVTSPLSIEVDFEKSISVNVISNNNKSSNNNNSQNNEEDNDLPRLRRTSSARKKQQLLKSEDFILSRLGVTQNRSPRTMKGAKNRRGATTETYRQTSDIYGNKNLRNKVAGRISAITTQPIVLLDAIELPIVAKAIVPNTKINETLSAATFDDDFYETVSLNVRNNLCCHLDGKLDTESSAPSQLSPILSDLPLRSTVVRSPSMADSEIHEATTLSAITSFPTLLTADQYGSEPSTSKIKRTFTKNSWKWKWDFIKKYKYVNEGGKIVKKIKQQTSGFRDLSKLDMWTQLTMRTKHEIIRRRENGNLNGETSIKLGIGEVAREEKRKMIEQLNKILDSRLLPEINVEQNEQRIIKQEVIVDEEVILNTTTELQDENLNGIEKQNFISTLNLQQRVSGTSDKNTVILSGEWARPRCYICFGCGSKFETLKILEEHKHSNHPYVLSTHYEIVGRELIERELYNHFYIPSKALQRHTEYVVNQQKNEQSQPTDKLICLEDSLDSVGSATSSIITKSETCDTDSNSNSKMSKISVTTTTGTTISNETVNTTISSNSRLKLNCTKCNRECTGILDLYRHMLDCSGDYAWLIAKKRMRYRYFGNRSRRRRGHHFRGRPRVQKSSANGEEGEEQVQRIKEPQTPRSKPSDAESIQRMLANLPPKRSCRQIIPNMSLKKSRARKMVPGITIKTKNGANKQNIRLTRTAMKNLNAKHIKIVKQNRRMFHEKKQIQLDSSPSLRNTIQNKKFLSSLKLKKKTSNIDENVEKNKSIMQIVQEKTKNVVRKITKNFNNHKDRTLRSRSSTSNSKSEDIDSEASSSKTPIKKSLEKNIADNTAMRDSTTKTTNKKSNEKVIVDTIENQESTSETPSKKSNEKNVENTTDKIITEKSNIIKNNKFVKKLSFRKSKNKYNRKAIKDDTFEKQITEVTTENLESLEENSKEKCRLLENIEEPVIVAEEKPMENELKVVENTSEITETDIKDSFDITESLTEESPKENIKYSTNTIITELEQKIDSATSKDSLHAMEDIEPPIMKKKKGRPFKNIFNKLKNAKKKSALADTEINNDKISKQVEAPIENKDTNKPQIESKGSNESLSVNTGAEIKSISILKPEDINVKCDLEICNQRNDIKVDEEVLVNQPIIVESTSITLPLSTSSSTTSLNSTHSNQLQIPSSSQTITSSLPKTPPSKKRVKKLNDCIAMLTGKLQQKLGIPFIEQQEKIPQSENSNLSMCNKEINKKQIIVMESSAPPRNNISENISQHPSNENQNKCLENTSLKTIENNLHLCQTVTEPIIEISKKVEQTCNREKDFNIKSISKDNLSVEIIPLYVTRSSESTSMPSPSVPKKKTFETIIQGPTLGRDISITKVSSFMHRRNSIDSSGLSKLLDNRMPIQITPIAAPSKSLFDVTPINFPRKSPIDALVQRKLPSTTVSTLAEKKSFESKFPLDLTPMRIMERRSTTAVPINVESIIDDGPLDLSMKSTSSETIRGPKNIIHDKLDQRNFAALIPKCIEIVPIVLSQSNIEKNIKSNSVGPIVIEPVNSQSVSSSPTKKPRKPRKSSLVSLEAIKAGEFLMPHYKFDSLTANLIASEKFTAMQSMSNIERAFETFKDVPKTTASQITRSNLEQFEKPTTGIFPNLSTHDNDFNNKNYTKKSLDFEKCVEIPVFSVPKQSSTSVVENDLNSTKNNKKAKSIKANIRSAVENVIESLIKIPNNRKTVRNSTAIGNFIETAITKQVDERNIEINKDEVIVDVNKENLSSTESKSEQNNEILESSSIVTKATGRKGKKGTKGDDVSANLVLESTTKLNEKKSKKVKSQKEISDTKIEDNVANISEPTADILDTIPINKIWKATEIPTMDEQNAVTKKDMQKIIRKSKKLKTVDLTDLRECDNALKSDKPSVIDIPNCSLNQSDTIIPSCINTTNISNVSEDHSTKPVNDIIASVIKQPGKRGRKPKVRVEQTLSKEVEVNKTSVLNASANTEISNKTELKSKIGIGNSALMHDNEETLKPSEVFESVDKSINKSLDSIVVLEPDVSSNNIFETDAAHSQITIIDNNVTLISLESKITESNIEKSKDILLSDKFIEPTTSVKLVEDEPIKIVQLKPKRKGRKKNVDSKFINDIANISSEAESKNISLEAESKKVISNDVKTKTNNNITDSQTITNDFVEILEVSKSQKANDEVKLQITDTIVTSKVKPPRKYKSKSKAPKEPELSTEELVNTMISLNKSLELVENLNKNIEKTGGIVESTEKEKVEEIITDQTSSEDTDTSKRKPKPKNKKIPKNKRKRKVSGLSTEELVDTMIQLNKTIDVFGSTTVAPEQNSIKLANLNKSDDNILTTIPPLEPPVSNTKSKSKKKTTIANKNKRKTKENELSTEELVNSMIELRKTIEIGGNTSQNNDKISRKEDSVGFISKLSGKDEIIASSKLDAVLKGNLNNKINNPNIKSKESENSRDQKFFDVNSKILDVPNLLTPGADITNEDLGIQANNDIITTHKSMKKNKTNKQNAKTETLECMTKEQTHELHVGPDSIITKNLSECEKTAVENIFLSPLPEKLTLDIADTTSKEIDTNKEKNDKETIDVQEKIEVPVQTPPVTKPRRKRQSELSAIIADQLLESFKEVDKSRIDELKLLHELSLERTENDDILINAVQTTPKRKTAMKVNTDAVESPKKVKLKKAHLTVTEINSNSTSQFNIADNNTKSKITTKSNKSENSPKVMQKKKIDKVERVSEEAITPQIKKTKLDKLNPEKNTSSNVEQQAENAEIEIIQPVCNAAEDKKIQPPIPIVGKKENTPKKAKNDIYESFNLSDFIPKRRSTRLLTVTPDITKNQSPNVTAPQTPVKELENLSINDGILNRSLNINENLNKSSENELLNRDESDKKQQSKQEESIQLVQKSQTREILDPRIRKKLAEQGLSVNEFSKSNTAVSVQKSIPVELENYPMILDTMVPVKSKNTKPKSISSRRKTMIESTRVISFSPLPKKAKEKLNLTLPVLRAPARITRTRRATMVEAKELSDSEMNESPEVETRPKRISARRATAMPVKIGKDTEKSPSKRKSPILDTKVSEIISKTKRIGNRRATTVDKYVIEKESAEVKATEIPANDNVVNIVNPRRILTRRATMLEKNLLTEIIDQPQDQVKGVVEPVRSAVSNSRPKRIAARRATTMVEIYHEIEKIADSIPICTTPLLTPTKSKRTPAKCKTSVPKSDSNATVETITNVDQPIQTNSPPRARRIGGRRSTMIERNYSELDDLPDSLLESPIPIATPPPTKRIGTRRSTMIDRKLTEIDHNLKIIDKSLEIDLSPILSKSPIISRRESIVEDNNEEDLAPTIENLIKNSPLMKRYDSPVKSNKITMRRGTICENDLEKSNQLPINDSTNLVEEQNKIIVEKPMKTSPKKITNRRATLKNIAVCESPVDSIISTNKEETDLKNKIENKIKLTNTALVINADLIDKNDSKSCKTVTPTGRKRKFEESISNLNPENANDNIDSSIEEMSGTPIRKSQRVSSKTLIDFTQKLRETSPVLDDTSLLDKSDAPKRKKSESDDELCLADIAKNLNTKIPADDEFSNCSDTPGIDDQILDMVLPLDDDLASSNKRIVEFDLLRNATVAADDLEDNNTNTELVDMDLEDDVSVYTSLSMDTTVTSNMTTKQPKKRRHRRSILFKSRKLKPQKVDDENFLEFICELCNKVFRKLDSLTKHKMTLTHIAKLSEQEFLNANRNPKNLEKSPLRLNEPVLEVSKIVKKRSNDNSDILPVQNLSNSNEANILPLQNSPIKSTPKSSNILAPTNSGIEPISSPEQVEVSYDNYNNTRNSVDNSRFALSQEERLFYECCNMLKGSDRNISSQVKLSNKNQNNIVYSVKSPMSHPRTSPRPGFPKIDLNQFSDISSDSNQQSYSAPISYTTANNNKILNPIENASNNNGLASFFASAEKYLNGTTSISSSTTSTFKVTTPKQSPKPSNIHLKDCDKTFEPNRSIATTYPENSMLIGSYSDVFSDMGDSFPSSQDASESENYAQTVLDRANTLKGKCDKTSTNNAKNIGDVDIIEDVRNSVSLQPSFYTSEKTDDLKAMTSRLSYGSPLHSNSSQSSTTSKLITKGALKGYDNFKVSIPTTGIDLHQALVRSSHIGSKLAALADIALGSDAPLSAELLRDHPGSQQNNLLFDDDKINIENVDAKIAASLDTIEKEDIVKPTGKNSGLKKKSAKKRNEGNKLGFKAKKHPKNPKTKKIKQAKALMKESIFSSESKKPIDIYEFEDSHDSTDKPIVPLSKVSGKFRGKLLTKEMVDLIDEADGSSPKLISTSDEKIVGALAEESQSTSFSDRDDFQYGVVESEGSDSEESNKNHDDDDSGDDNNKLPETNNLQTKCLIMGRIFKNAKKAQATIEPDIEQGETSSTSKTKKLPKQELDKLFDSLKQVEKSSEELQNNDNNSNSEFSEVQMKRSSKKSKKSREIQMLEEEWGMSLEQIKEIIGVGQRKSQRKCAVGKQKILAETWSSDEYEDFHTTKDIIALIQETEIKALQRRNRNNSKNNKKVEKVENEIKEDSSNNINSVKETSQNTDEPAPQTSTQTRNSKENVSSTLKAEKKLTIVENVDHYKINDDKIVEENMSTSEIKPIKKAAKIKAQRRRSTAKPKLVYYDSESDFEADWNRSARRNKIKKRRQTTAFREIKLNNLKETKSQSKTIRSATNVSDNESKVCDPSNDKILNDEINEPEIEQSKVQKPIPQVKKEVSKNSVKESKEKEKVSKDKEKGGKEKVGKEKEKSGKEKGNGKGGKGGRKVPMSRTKRTSSEMLYYWSSSSDEDFGRIKTSRGDDDEDDDDETEDIDHLQQHGWIVGDSHKKLVTLLAHAKGKMSDDCGVKESGNKKKS